MLDLNLDGAINQYDRAVEIINWTSERVDLRNYRLAFGGIDDQLCLAATTNDAPMTADLTYLFPRYSYVRPQGYKVVFGESLVDLEGERFDIPLGSTATQVALCDPSGRLLDRLVYAWPGKAMCWARVPTGSGAWTVQGQTLGVPN